ncbi:GGDEF domain-containing protein [Thiobacillus denitrificans]|uniref:GGDEF domain-containing protein n=1 Tax=Thiobacillus denitrificans TaxID=36861 RepID=UPI000A6CB55E|nr:sensor domain-containing diguanylate cyclase [Thiobacillus denitrificans]
MNPRLIAQLLVDQAGRITLANAQAETLFGYDRSELIDQPVEMLVPSRFAARHVGHRAGFMAESHSRPMGAAVELFARRKDGSELPVDIMLSPMLIAGRHFTLCVARDITERKAAADKLRQQTAELQKLHAELKELANRDSLTGLLNRRAFHEHAAQMLRTARRRKESAALLMIDLDHFKEVNDRFGHAEGDHVLKMVAAALKATARGNDIVARYGDEEFVVAVLGASDAESIAAAERLRLATAAIKNTKSTITASIGVTTCTPQVHKRDTSLILETLLAQADRTLYAAKANGRNQVCHVNSLAQADSFQ